jgi:hypothetical protein
MIVPKAKRNRVAHDPHVRCYGASGDAIASIGKFIKQAMAPSALK